MSGWSNGHGVRYFILKISYGDGVKYKECHVNLQRLVDP